MNKPRSRVLSLLCVWLGLGLVFAGGRPLFGQVWADTNAFARLRIEKNPDSPWPARVGSFQIAPCLPGANYFSVFTPDAGQVAAQVLWSASGELTCIQFDTSSGSTAYCIYFDRNPPPPVSGWRPEAGVVVETRACADRPVDTWDQISRLVNSSTTVYGRGFVPRIFLGGNPFGPSDIYLAIFSGWFNVTRAGEYTFATVSDDASYLQVDRVNVASWLGRHGAQDGRRGEHNGRIQLKPGVHRIDYVQVQMGGASSAVAAWKPPGRAQIEVMPPTAFLPVAQFRATGFDTAPGAPNLLYFEWRDVNHCAIDDAAAVRVRLRVVDSRPRRTYRWHFDDGDESSGPVGPHFFPATGLRQVSVEALEGRTCVASNTARIRVEPNWLQIDPRRDDIFNDAKSDFLRRNLMQTPARDLAEMLKFGDAAEDRQLVNRIGEAIIKRQGEFATPAFAVTFYRLGISFQNQGDWGDDLAEQALRIALLPQHSSSVISDKAKLLLADLLIRRTGQSDEAEKLLGSAPGGSLTYDDRREWRILQGDLLLARGKVAEAEQQYRAVGEAATKPDARFDLSRSARLESASLSFHQGNFDEAEQILDRLLFEVPLEHLSLDAGLVRLDLDLKRKCYHRAFTGSRTLLHVVGHDPRKADILYAQAQAAYALGKTEDARHAVLTLLKEFPYSEPAAKAEDQWGKRR